MEALKKAELAKQHGQEVPEGTAAGGALRLEPIDAAGIPPMPAPEPAPLRTLPELPSQLGVLDSEFMAHAPPRRASAPPGTPLLPSATPPAAHTPAIDPGRTAPSLDTHPTHPQQTRPTAPAGRPAAPPSRTADPGQNSQARPRSATKTHDDGERIAAQQVFTAKQPGDKNKKNFAIAIGAMSFVGMVGIGGYFWWQLQPKSGLGGVGVARPTPTIAMTPPAPPQPTSTAPPPVAISPAVPLPPTFSGTPGTAIAAAKPIAPTANNGDKSGNQDDSDDVEPVVAPKVRPGTTARAPVAERLPEPEGPIRISKSQLRINPGVARGFESLGAGDLATAKAEYERVLRTEPKNGDAIHGMAAIALRDGDTATAADWYLKAIEADPKDAAAQAWLIGHHGQGDPTAFESRLKTLIAGQPNVAALHFALGNIHARQSRWNEAQQSYFKAFSIESEHPDYLYNLAVSLDHLRQTRLAAQYYSQALAAAEQRPAGFDKAQAGTRLRELQP